MLVFCRESAQARSCLEMLSARDLRSEISDLRSLNAGKRSNKQYIERVSPHEPREMYRNVNV